MIATIGKYRVASFSCAIFDASNVFVWRMLRAADRPLSSVADDAIDYIDCTSQYLQEPVVRLCPA